MSYGAVADRLGIQPGLAYMIATGLPAVGSNSQSRENPTTNDSVLSWIKQRASTDAPMLRAAADRTAHPGQPHDPDDDKDIVTVLTRDHDQVTSLLEQIAAIPGHKKGGAAWHIGRRESIADMIIKRLTSHEAAAEEQLWPRVRKELPDGDRWAKEGLAQEHEASETLAKLRDADPDSDEFDELVEQLTLQARKHVAHKDRVFLQLRAVMPYQRERVGRKARAKRNQAKAAEQESPITSSDEG